jgi:hypothetical protein
MEGMRTIPNQTGRSQRFHNLSTTGPTCCIGTHVSAASCILKKDEGLFGCTQFGIGRALLGAPSHTDGIVISPSVWAHEVQLEDEPLYVRRRFG